MDAWPGRLPAPGGRQRLGIQMQRWKWRAKDALRQGERVAMETRRPNRGGKDPHWDGLGAIGDTGTMGAMGAERQRHWRGECTEPCRQAAPGAGSVSPQARDLA